MSDWVKGKLPTKSGNYEVKYSDGIIGRDDFTVVGNHWWNVGDSKHPEQVEWRPDSYIPCIDHYCTSVKAVKLRDVIDIIEKGR